MKVKGSTPRAAWEPRGYWAPAALAPGTGAPGQAPAGVAPAAFLGIGSPSLSWAGDCPARGGRGPDRCAPIPPLRVGGAKPPSPFWTRSLSPCRPRPGVPCVLPGDGSLIPWRRVTRTWRALQRGLLDVRPMPRGAAAGSPTSIGVGEAGGSAPGYFPPPALSATMPALVPDPLFPLYWSG